MLWGVLHRKGKLKKGEIIRFSPLVTPRAGSMGKCLTWLEMQQGSESVSQEQTHPKGLVELGGDKN